MDMYTGQVWKHTQDTVWKHTQDKCGRTHTGHSVEGHTQDTVWKDTQDTLWKHTHSGQNTHLYQNFYLETITPLVNDSIKPALIHF